MECKIIKSGEFYNIPNEKVAQPEKSIEQSSVTELELKAFNKPPIIDFGRVFVGNRRERQLKLVNPYEQEVEVAIQLF